MRASPGSNRVVTVRRRQCRHSTDAADLAQRLADTPNTAGPHEYETWQITPSVQPLKDAVVGGVGDLLWILMATIGWCCSSPAPTSPICCW
jgi:hypothetical protein